MNIIIKDTVGLSADDVIKLTYSLLNNRAPKIGELDYGLETHGAIGVTYAGFSTPIQVKQSNKRKTKNSPIEIRIEIHKPL